MGLREITRCPGLRDERQFTVWLETILREHRLQLLTLMNNDMGNSAYKYIVASDQAAGNLHLSGTTWSISKALIKYIRVITVCADWSLYILQNDNGYAANDALISKQKIADSINGNANLWLDLPYEDEDDSDEVHLYYTGAQNATFIIKGIELI